VPTLDWIGKSAVVRHHKDVPYRLLEPVPELCCGDPASGNLIVQGDNLHALKALLPRYADNDKLGEIELPPSEDVKRYYKFQDERVATRGPYCLQPLATNGMDTRPNLRHAIPTGRVCLVR